MPPNEPIQFPQLPFLTREMLEFGNKSKFELVVRSNQTTQRTIEIRGFTRSGRINIKHIGTSTTVLTETIQQVGDIPIMLAVVPTALANSHGDLYVSVSLRVDGDISIPLVAGYVTQAKGLSWPNTNLGELVPAHGGTNSIQVTAPAAGAEWTHTVSANRIWHIRSITCTMVADANVATRTLTITATHLGTSNIQGAANFTQAANETRTYTLAAGLGVGPSAAFNKIFGALPIDFWLAGEDVIASETNNIQVGDQYSVIALNIDEFFEGA